MFACPPRSCNTGRRTICWLVISVLSFSTLSGCSRSGAQKSAPRAETSPGSKADGAEQKIQVAPSTARTGPSLGSSAPLFSGMAHNGDRVSLEALRGKVVVLYFYPKDGTPGCTTEAQEFRDSFPAFQAKNAVIVGVSRDDASSHQEFATDENLPFILLPDIDGALAQAYGVGSTFGFSQRMTFVIDREGKIAEIYRQVDPKTHAKEVLRLIDTL